MSIPNQKLTQVLTWFYLKTLLQFQEKFLITLPLLFHSFLLLPLPCASPLSKCLSAACWYSTKDSNALSNFANTSEAVFLLSFSFKTANWWDTSFFCHWLLLHLKEQHGDCRNFNLLHEHYSQERIERCQKTYAIVIWILHCEYG